MTQAAKTSPSRQPDAPLLQRVARTITHEWQLWALLLPAILFFIVVCYFPMYGVQIAFRDYKAAFGITGSKWVGLKHFETFFSSYYCGRMFANTFLLNFLGLIFGFPIPILMAILLNQLNSKRFMGFTQTAIYVPHFISTVVLAGMIYLFFSPTSGIVNRLITMLGGSPIYFMMEESWFRPLFMRLDNRGRVKPGDPVPPVGSSCSRADPDGLSGDSGANGSAPGICASIRRDHVTVIEPGLNERRIL